MLHVGLCGLGVVGGGLFSLVKTERLPLNIKKILVTRKKGPRKRPAPEELLTESPQDILDDQSINCIVEVMGGTTTSWDVIKKALLSGKHVVTANKTLVAHHLNEIQALLEAHPHLHFRFEAAAGGGLPIINLLTHYLSTDEILSFYGILNGTTNYILDQMEQCSIELDQALSLAQRQGYAEMDSRADVSGEDSLCKLVILANLCFGVAPRVESVGCVGIQHIERIDFTYARSLRKMIKLLAVCRLTWFDDTRSLVLYVAPSLVGRESALSHVTSSLNAICIESKILGKSVYVAQGAGANPTAYAVSRDLLDIQECLLHQVPSPKILKNATLSSLSCISDYTAEFYIRFTTSKSNDTVNSIIDMLHLFSIQIKLKLDEIPFESCIYIAFITTQCLSSLVYRCVKLCEEKSNQIPQCILEPPVVLQFFDDTINQFTRS